MAEEQKPPQTPAPTSPATGGATAAPTETKGKKGKKKSKKNIQTGIVFIQSTFNNTIITITDVSGNVLSWSSAGARLQKVAQVDAVRRPGRRGRRRRQGDGARPEERLRAGEGPRGRPRVRPARARRGGAQ